MQLQCSAAFTASVDYGLWEELKWKGKFNTNYCYHQNTYTSCEDKEVQRFTCEGCYVSPKVLNVSSGFMLCGSSHTERNIMKP